MQAAIDNIADEDALASNKEILRIILNDKEIDERVCEQAAYALRILADARVIASLLEFAPEVVNEENQAVIVYADALRNSQALQRIISSYERGKRRVYLINNLDMSNKELFEGLEVKGISKQDFNHIFVEQDPERVVDKIMPVLIHTGTSQVRVFAWKQQDRAAWRRQRMVDVLILLLQSKEFEIITPDEHNRRLYEEERSRDVIFSQA